MQAEPFHEHPARLQLVLSLYAAQPVAPPGLLFPPLLFPLLLSGRIMMSGVVIGVTVVMVNTEGVVVTNSSGDGQPYTMSQVKLLGGLGPT